MTVNTWVRLRRTLDRVLPGCEVGRLKPPATEEQIRAAEAVIGLRFPPDLREAYLHADGVEYSGRFGFAGERVPKLILPYFDWAPLGCVVYVWQMKRTIAAEHPEFTAGLPTPAPHDATWDGGWSLPEWIPIGDSGMSPCAACDMRPGPAGRPGQLIKIDIQDGTASVIDISFESYVTRLLDAIDAGDLIARDSQWVHPGSGRAPFRLREIGY